ncbi:MAG: anhydro-N-acetylmuramic acid kinase [Gammaproteobacteria bacterium]|nr:anhydro-N-acetylmuramic acid kinase [Gammaproteobacteria bacterium]MCH9744562.1 anhydro-N-acetylmuramic acid kinase [Gammaproteobacteria bacterium]
MNDTFKNWTITQPEKAALLDQPTIVIGCMTGTSADSKADFSLVVFDKNSMPILYKNVTHVIPEVLKNELGELSRISADKISMARRSKTEASLTDYLAIAFTDVIKQTGLSDYPKEKIILSPHGQTIDHKPLAEPPYCDILLNGDVLAETIGHAVVSRHRQMPITVSMAAPLAPVLIKKLFHTPEKNRVILNGGGIANICVLLKDQPDALIGYDTGPANGPIDALIQYVLKNSMADIPADLVEAIQSQQCDVDGQFAARGKVNDELLAALLVHEYFKRDSKQKSADRAMFDLAWIFQDKKPSDKPINLADRLATISEAVAKSIADAITESLTQAQRKENTEIIIYGGLLHNKHMIQRIKYYLDMRGKFTFTSMGDLHYDPDYFESLLMAYLGYCVISHTPIDLRYCARPGHDASAVIPGSLSIPAALQNQTIINNQSDSNLHTLVHLNELVD